MIDICSLKYFNLRKNDVVYIKVRFTIVDIFTNIEVGCLIRVVTSGVRVVVFDELGYLSIRFIKLNVYRR